MEVVSAVSLLLRRQQISGLEKQKGRKGRGVLGALLDRGAEIKGDTVKSEVCCLGRDGWMDWRLQQVAALHLE
jgi:hypothetical protein